MNYIILILYAIFAVTGSNLMKLGGTMAKSINIPIIDINISLLSIVGFISYGISFVLYFILLNKFELSFVSAMTLSLVYSLLFLSSIFLFHETFTMSKLFGFLFILIGALLIIKK
jgi:hypothetical protein